MSGRNLFTASALALVAVVAACSDNSTPSTSPSSGLGFAVGGPTAGVVDTGEFELCKHGTSATFNYSVDGGGTQSVSLADGGCAVLASNTVLGAGNHTVSVTEVADASIVLDSIVATTNTIFNPGGTRGAPITGTATFSSPYNGDHGVLVEYYNSPAPPPPPPPSCTYTQGYWKNHTSAWPAPFSPSAPFYSSGNTWLGILNTPAKGSGYIILGYQFIAASLNGTSGAPANVQQAMVTANAYFTDPVANPLSKTQLTTLSTLLDDYNNGRLGVPHCP